MGTKRKGNNVHIWCGGSRYFETITSPSFDCAFCLQFCPLWVMCLVNSAIASFSEELICSTLLGKQGVIFLVEREPSAVDGQFVDFKGSTAQTTKGVPQLKKKRPISGWSGMQSSQFRKTGAPCQWLPTIRRLAPFTSAQQEPLSARMWAVASASAFCRILITEQLFSGFEHRNERVITLFPLSQGLVGFHRKSRGEQGEPF